MITTLDKGDLGNKMFKIKGTKTLRVVSALTLSIICIIPAYLSGLAFVILICLIGMRIMWEWVRMGRNMHPFLYVFWCASAFIYLILPCLLVFWMRAQDDGFAKLFYICLLN